MAGISETITLNWTNGATPIQKNVTITADAADPRSFTVPGSTTDHHVLLSVDVSALKLLYIYSDATVTIQTNDGTMPDDTLTITADKPLVWYEGCGLANPLTVDVTDLYVTKAGAGDANVEIRVMQDATP